MSWTLPEQVFSLSNNRVSRLQCCISVIWKTFSRMKWHICQVRCSFFLQVLLFLCLDTKCFLFQFLQNYSLAAGTLYPKLIVPSYNNVCPWHGKMSNGSFIAFISPGVERGLVQVLGRGATLEWELTVNLPTTDPLNVPGPAVALTCS